MSETEDAPEPSEDTKSDKKPPKKKKNGGKKKKGKKGGGKGKGKFLTILSTLIFVLAITGGVTYYFFFTGKPPATEAVAEKGGKGEKAKPEEVVEEEEVEIPFEEMTPEQQKAVLQAAEDEAITAISGRYSPAGSVDGHLLSVGNCATTFILIAKDKLYRKSPGQKPYIDKLIGLKRDENTPFGKAKYALIAESKYKGKQRLHKFGLFKEEYRRYLIIIEVDKDRAEMTENSGSTRAHYLPCTVAKK